MNGLFCIANSLELGRRKTFFENFMDFNPPPNLNEVKQSHNIFLIGMALKLASLQSNKKQVKATLPAENADI